MSVPRRVSELLDLVPRTSVEEGYSGYNWLRPVREEENMDQEDGRLTEPSQPAANGKPGRRSCPEPQFTRPPGTRSTSFRLRVERRESANRDQIPDSFPPRQPRLDEMSIEQYPSLVKPTEDYPTWKQREIRTRPSNMRLSLVLNILCSKVGLPHQEPSFSHSKCPGEAGSSSLCPLKKVAVRVPKSIVKVPTSERQSRRGIRPSRETSLRRGTRGCVLFRPRKAETSAASRHGRVLQSQRLWDSTSTELHYYVVIRRAGRGNVRRRTQ